MIFEDFKWLLSLLFIPIGWAVKRLVSCMTREDVKEIIKYEIAPIEEHNKTLSDKIDDIEAKLVRLEIKIDRLPELIINTLLKRVN